MQLKGMHWGYRARKDGSRTYYYWAWKNGPQIHKGDQLPAEIPPEHPVVAAYQAAHRAAREKKAVGAIHPKAQPVILTREYWRAWLTEPWDTVKAFIHPSPDDEMEPPADAPRP